MQTAAAYRSGICNALTCLQGHANTGCSVQETMHVPFSRIELSVSRFRRTAEAQKQITMPTLVPTWDGGGRHIVTRIQQHSHRPLCTRGIAGVSGAKRSRHAPHRRRAWRAVETLGRERPSRKSMSYIPCNTPNAHSAPAEERR